VIDTLGVEEGRAAFDAVDFVAFFQKEFREVGTVLAGDACDKCFFHKILISSFNSQWSAGRTAWVNDAGSMVG
jgi:hypothetical protein